MRRWSLTLSGLVSLVLLLGLAASSSALAAPAAAPVTWRVTAGAQSADMAVQVNLFLQETVAVDAGDTVEFVVPTGEPHTITFLAAGAQRPVFNIQDPQQVQKQGGDVYDGRSYFNSGLLTNGGTYRLTFPSTGSFSYICLLHGAMNGGIVVQAAGAAYPKTQAQLDAEGKVRPDTLIAQWQPRLVREANRAPKPDGTTAVGVVTIGVPEVMLARFLPGQITITEGDTVVWENQDPEAPHTVTFGQPSGNPVLPSGNPVAFDGSSPLNSGFMGAHFPVRGSFSVTFTRAGTYSYICLPHAPLGMRGTITVLPRAAAPAQAPAAQVPAAARPAAQVPAALPRTGDEAPPPLAAVAALLAIGLGLGIRRFAR